MASGKYGCRAVESCTIGRTKTWLGELLNKVHPYNTIALFYNKQRRQWGWQRFMVPFLGRLC